MATRDIDLSWWNPQPPEPATEGNGADLAARDAASLLSGAIWTKIQNIFLILSEHFHHSSQLAEQPAKSIDPDPIIGSMIKKPKPMSVTCIFYNNEGLPYPGLKELEGHYAFMCRCYKEDGCLTEPRNLDLAGTMLGVGCAILGQRNYQVQVPGGIQPLVDTPFYRKAISLADAVVNLFKY
jgi:hypothetical protein